MNRDLKMLLASTSEIHRLFLLNREDTRRHAKEREVANQGIIEF